jgi:hypothetical protein
MHSRSSHSKLAAELAAGMNKEASMEEAVNHFHGYFRLNDHRCAVSPDRIAVWRLKRAGILLSALVATVLANEGLTNAGDLEL